MIAFVRQLLQLAGPSRRLLVVLVGLTALEACAAVPTPLLFAWLVDRLLAGATGSDVAIFAGAVIGLELVAGALRVLRVRLNRHFALAAANRLRDRFFAHLLHLPYSHFLDHQAGGQANSYLNDIDDIDTAVTGLIDKGVRSLLLLTVLGITLAIWNPLIAGAAALMLPLTIWGQRALRRRVRSSSREKVGLREELTGRVAEAVQHAALVKSYRLEDHIQERVDDISDRYSDAEVVMETGQAALRSMASVLLIGTQYAFFVFGGCLVIADRLGVGDFLGQMVLLGRLTAPMNTLLEFGNELARSEAALYRVRQLLATPAEGGTEPRPVTSLGDERGGLAVSVRALQFRFRDDLPLLEGWSFDVAAGETVAIVGPSGCGKTTLFHLLLGLHAGYRGELRLGGTEIGQIALPTLRRAVGVVFQEQQLLNASVRDNLAMGVDDPASLDDAACWEALRQAHAADVVEQLPDGLDTRIGVDGIKLSGGQRQRLALAQAIVKNPPLLLLDEATSALDSFSERHVQAALRDLFVGRTNIVIAHRLSTVVDADRIVVVDQGRVLDQGTHTDLLERCPLYRRLSEAQIEGFLDWERLREEEDS